MDSVSHIRKVFGKRAVTGAVRTYDEPPMYQIANTTDTPTFAAPSEARSLLKDVLEVAPQR